MYHRHHHPHADSTRTVRHTLYAQKCCRKSHTKRRRIYGAIGLASAHAYHSFYGSGSGSGSLQRSHCNIFVMCISINSVVMLECIQIISHIATYARHNLYWHTAVSRQAASTHSSECMNILKGRSQVTTNYNRNMDTRITVLWWADGAPMPNGTTAAIQQPVRYTEWMILIILFRRNWLGFCGVDSIEIRICKWRTSGVLRQQQPAHTLPWLLLCFSQHSLGGSLLVIRLSLLPLLLVVFVSVVCGCDTSIRKCNCSKGQVQAVILKHPQAYRSPMLMEWQKCWRNFLPGHVSIQPTPTQPQLRP